MTAQANPITSTEYTRHVEDCQVCGANAFELIAPEGSWNYQVLGCTSCGLLFASPTLSEQGLQDFYDDEFKGDAGGGGAAAAGKVHKSLEKLIATARERFLPHITRHMPDLKDKKILDLRSRNGALASVLKQEGALVMASDPMAPNVDLCRQAGLESIQLTIADHYTLDRFADGSFDAITGLTIHIPAHLPEPRRFLNQALRVLKPGGLLILNEKDVLVPRNITRDNIFASGFGHFFHFTPDSLSNLVQSCGFEVLEVETDKARKSGFAHLIVTARRPDRPASRSWSPPQCDMARLKSEISDASAIARKVSGRNRLRQKTKRLLRNVIPGR